MLIRITAPHFCAGLIVGERTAPILHYMRHWTKPMIVAYILKKGWKLEVL